MRELPERAELALKILCLVLTALVVYQLAGILIRWNPFRGVTVPALPSLSASTNSPAGGAHGTNMAASATIKGTNLTQLPPNTNTPPSVIVADTNSVSPPMAVEKGTNFNMHGDLVLTNASVETNVVAHQETKLSRLVSNSATGSPDKGTNQVISTNSVGINVAAGSKPDMKVANTSSVPAMAGVNLNPFGPPGKSGRELPPAIQARISRITDSEILGPVMRPLPMALLGIAGDVAFLRTASGQTGLVKEGDSLGDLKLLRIGINRVLVEQDGQKKELMIFSGYGGESLLPSKKDNPDENKHS
jgi:hypothetical protein